MNETTGNETSNRPQKPRSRWFFEEWVVQLVLTVAVVVALADGVLSLSGGSICFEPPCTPGRSPDDPCELGGAIPPGARGCSAPQRTGALQAAEPLLDDLLAAGDFLDQRFVVLRCHRRIDGTAALHGVPRTIFRALLAEHVS